MDETTKLKKRFEELQQRLEALESTVPLASELVHMSERLNIPLNLYHDQLRQMVVLNGIKERLPEIGKDDMARAILQALLEKPEINISQITNKVGQLRGKASRRIIAERLEKLEEINIVEHRIGKNNEKVYSLRSYKKE